MQLRGDMDKAAPSDDASAAPMSTPVPSSILANPQHPQIAPNLDSINSGPSRPKKKKKSSLRLLESSLMERNRVRDEETDSLTHNELVCSYKQKRKYKKVGCCSLPPGFGICGLKRRDTKRACQIVQGRLAPSPPFLFSCD